MSSSVSYFPPEKSLISRNIQTKTLSITSGKGGVGKTTLLVNLAKTLSLMGHRVLILDGDFGMANVDVMFGIKPSYNLYDVIMGTKSLEDIIVQVDENIDLIPGGSGIYELSQLDVIQRYNLLNQVNELDEHYDFFLIDTAPGIGDNVLYLNSCVQDIAVILTPEPASMTDAYALIKVMNQRLKLTEFKIICNLVRDEVEGMRIYQRFSEVVDQFLCINLSYAGFVPVDLNLRQSTRLQRLLFNHAPKTISQFAIRKIAENLSSYQETIEPQGGMKFFWEQLLSVAS